MVARASRRLTDAYRNVASDIFKFCQAMRFTPTWQQRQVLQAVMDAEYGKGLNWITVRSGQGPGKTTVSVIIGLWRSIQATVDPKTKAVKGALTVVTAPTMRQCTDVWLSEAKSLIAGAETWLKNIFEVTATRIKIANDRDWGVKTVTASKEENAQGYHNPRLTVIAEEASGIPEALITQYKGTLSNPNSLFIQIGNPNSRESAFFNSFYGPGNHEWRKFVFNAEDTARDYPHIVTPERNRKLADEFGEDSDVYRIRVLGEFPHSDPNCVISGELVDRAWSVDPYTASITPRHESFGGGLARQIGLDFARYGGDESVVMRRQGYALLEWSKFVRKDPSVAVDRAFRMQMDAGWTDAQCTFVADAGGMGQGLMHRFEQANKSVVEFHNGGSSTRPRQFANKVTEGWFHLSHLLKQGVVHLPKDHLLMQQLSGRQYYTNKKGQLIVESKDEYMKRGHDSPDRADACIYAFWDHIRAVGHSSRKGESKGRVSKAA